MNMHVDTLEQTVRHVGHRTPPWTFAAKSFRVTAKDHDSSV